ncbi:glycosyltransferase family protein [Arthrobacter sp. TMN-50]
MPEQSTAVPRQRILVLSFSQIRRDPRVLRQINLFSAFADVISCGYGEAPDGVVRHIQVPDEYSQWRTSYKMVALMYVLRFHERLYFDSSKVRFVREQVPRASVDIVVANDAIAAPLARALQPRKGVHLDLHEYAPRQGEDNRRWRLLVGPYMRWACRKYVTRADSVTTVAKGIAEEYARVFGIAEPAVVPNAAPYASGLTPTPVASPMRIIHTGAAGRGRKIEVMIDAVCRANEIKPGTATLDVVLVPGEQRYIEELQAKVDALPAGMIRLIPPVQFQQIIPLLHEYDVGLFLCPPSTFNLRHALPNKLFEFIQARLAVVIGPSPEMETVVRQHDVGLVAQGFDAESTAQLLVGLTPERIALMKQASHRAAGALSAEKLSAPWIDAISKIGSKA